MCCSKKIDVVSVDKIEMDSALTELTFQWTDKQIKYINKIDLDSSNCKEETETT